VSTGINHGKYEHSANSLASERIATINLTIRALPPKSPNLNAYAELLVADRAWPHSRANLNTGRYSFVGNQPATIILTLRGWERFPSLPRPLLLRFGMTPLLVTRWFSRVWSSASVHKVTRNQDDSEVGAERQAVCAPPDKVERRGKLIRNCDGADGHESMKIEGPDRGG
jgi:hypothetical protein